MAVSSLESAQRVARKNNVLAPIALLVSCFGVFTFGIAAPVGAVLGHLARRQIRTTGQAGDGMARAAVIVGWSVTALVGCIGATTALLVVVKGAAIFGGIMSLFQ
jgi:hypothetical protein